MIRAFALFAGLVIAVHAVNSQASIVVTSSSTQAYAFNGTVFDFDAPLNMLGVTIDAVAAPYVSESIGNASFAGDSALFTADFDQIRGGVASGFTQGIVSISFSTTVDVPFAASSSFSHSAGHTEFLNSLSDTTSGIVSIYSSFQMSDASLANLTFGTVTGTLLAGHSYEWIVNALAVGLQNDAGATAVGSATLRIGEVQAVPELPSMAVWSLLATILGGAAWARR